MACDTLSSAILAYPLSEAVNYLGTKWHVMICGCICFFIQGLALLLCSNDSISQWQLLVPLYMIHGIARCIFENTNKALMTDYFLTVREREVSFTTIYFVSGISAAFAFAFFQYIDRFTIALINTIFPVISLICFHISFVMSRKREDGLISRELRSDVTVLFSPRQSKLSGYKKVPVQG
jgi:hypothetical protein